MFDRRLKIFLAIIFGLTLVLVARAMQIQVMQHDRWSDKAAKIGKKVTYVETVRGKILDFRGRTLAENVPCIDAMVDYRAILHEPDEKWVREIAGQRLARRMGDEFTKAPKSKRNALAKPEMLAVKSDLQAMWTVLARCPGMDEQKIEDARQAVIRKVENRARWIWYRNYKAAMDTHEQRKPDAWYARWMLSDDKPPELDQFKITVGDERESYTIVPAIDAETITMLGKNLSRLPGLSLKPSTHRFYPYREAGCHWIGNLAPVTAEERQKDTNFGNERLRYDYNDLIGRAGIESLAEPILRGERGLVESDANAKTAGKVVPSVAGQDVQTSVDIELQKQIEAIFPSCVVRQRDKPDEVRQFHGAAVVIDVSTGQVRAMASYPTFDPNKMQENYATLSTNELEKPLLNRATMDVLEPGSTVKPLVGLWGMKCGVLGVNEQIQCTGYMMYQGKKQIAGRCWVVRRFSREQLEKGISTINHPIPIALNHDLSFADALERSCNPFHETIADRLGVDRLTEGFKAFGLGQATGIGIAESVGRMPDSYEGMHPLDSLWSAGIGQGQVGATPLQMAGAVATIARGGIWMRPTLLASEVDPGKLRPAVRTTRPAREDLGIPPEAIAEAHQGMWNVVHGAAGTGKYLDFDEVGVCGKTGTAQAAKFLVPQLDADGRAIPKLDADGKPIKDKYGRVKPVMIPLEYGTPGNPNPIAPWYQAGGASGTDLDHAWYIGFAPRENPKIAFAVLVEYGGSGGVTAAAVAHEVLAACVQQGYLSR